MNKKQALEILAKRESVNGESLYNCGWYLSWSPGDQEATLDGAFDAEELEAIAWWMRNKSKTE
jgi:hypothetical protein